MASTSSKWAVSGAINNGFDFVAQVEAPGTPSLLIQMTQIQGDELLFFPKECTPTARREARG